MFKKRLINWALAVTSILLISSCGTTEEEAKEELNENKVGLDPAPGTYESGVAVRFFKHDNSVGSGLVSFENDSTSNCSYANPDYNSDGSDACYMVNKTTTITYYLWNFAASSDRRTATFTINPKQVNVFVNDIELAESKTLCRVSSEGTGYKLEGRATLNNPSDSSKNIYLFFSVNDTSKIGENLIISDSYKSGIEVTGTGDSIPSSAYNFRPNGSNTCSVSLNNFKLGQSASGTISCNISRSSSIDPFGSSISITSASWQCDEWGTL